MGLLGWEWGGQRSMLDRYVNQERELPRIKKLLNNKKHMEHRLSVNLTALNRSCRVLATRWLKPLKTMVYNTLAKTKSG